MDNRLAELMRSIAIEMANKTKLHGPLLGYKQDPFGDKDRARHDLESWQDFVREWPQKDYSPKEDL